MSELDPKVRREILAELKGLEGRTLKKAIRRSCGLELMGTPLAEMFRLQGMPFDEVLSQWTWQQMPTEEKAKYVGLLVANGIVSPNEARGMLQLEPLPGGDVLLKPGEE